MTSLWFGRKCSVGPRIDSYSYRKLGCFVEPSAFIREICDSLFRGKQTGGRNHGSYGMTRKNDLFSVPFCVLPGCQNLRDLIDPAGRHSAISKTFEVCLPFPRTSRRLFWSERPGDGTDCIISSLMKGLLSTPHGAATKFRLRFDH
jgi:hypothetical protein